MPLLPGDPLRVLVRVDSQHLRMTVDPVGLGNVRQLAKARVTLLSQIKRSMIRQRQLTGGDLDSLVDLVRSQLTVTGGLRR